MATETEIERLIVTLMGDGSGYREMLETAQRETEQASREIQRSATLLDKIQGKLEAVGAGFANVGKRLKQAGQSLTLGLTVPIVGFGLASTKAFADFDLAMTESTSIMDVTEEQTKRMRETALDLSSAAIQGPDVLARSYFYLASAGKSAEQAMSLLPSLSDFATAGAFDMALATDLLTDAQSALGLSSKDVAKDTENLGRVADVLVKANILANASVQEFSESITNDAGAALRAFGKDIEEGTALLAAYADQGQKGRVAGADLARVILLLGHTSRNSAKEHARLGFEVFDAQGKMNNFADIMKNLEDIMKGMSPEMKGATLATLGFTAEVQKIMLPLIGTSESIRRYEKELRKAGGITREVAQKQLKAFTNELLILKNQVTVLAIEIGEMLVPYIRIMMGWISKAIEVWKGFSDQTKLTIIAIAAVVATVGPLLIGLGAMFALIGFAINGMLASAAVIGPILATIFSPVGLAIAAVIGGIVLLVDYLGGIGPAFAIAKQAAMDFYSFVAPVFIQLYNLAKTVFVGTWEVVTYVFGLIADYIASVFGGPVGATFMDFFRMVRDGLIDVLIFAEYAFNNAGDVAALAFVSAQYSAVKFFNEVVHFFTDVLPAVMVWFGNNWQDIFFTAADYAMTVLINLGQNIRNIFSNIMEIISGEVDLADLWTPLTKGFVNTIKELPEIPERQIGELEAQLKMETDALGDVVGKGYNELREQRLKELFPEGSSPEAEQINQQIKDVEAIAVPTAEDVGKAVGQALGAGIKAEPIDAATMDSAEAIARIAEFRSLVAAPTPQGNVGVGQPNLGQPANSTEKTDSKQVSELQDINAGINVLVSLTQQELDRNSGNQQLAIAGF